MFRQRLQFYGPVTDTGSFQQGSDMAGMAASPHQNSNAGGRPVPAYGVDNLPDFTGFHIIIVDTVKAQDPHAVRWFMHVKRDTG